MAKTDDQRPRVLVVGHGHAGGSVARAALAVGCDTTVWGRRPEHETVPALQGLINSGIAGRRLTYRVVDVNDARVELAAEFRRFDWVVLANEPRPQRATEAEITRLVARTRSTYRHLRAARFDHPDPSVHRRMVVRIGSPAAERPAPDSDDFLRLPYFDLKRRLQTLATDEAATGLPLLTVAPGEIHSPFSTYGPNDPYSGAAKAGHSIPLVFDLAAAAVSGQSLGEAVLAAAAVGVVGGWYRVSDGVLGPGQALARMIELSGAPSPHTVTWDQVAGRHLFNVLVGTAALDLDLLAIHGDGLDSSLGVARSLRSVQQAALAGSLWWAGPAVRRAADRMVHQLNASTAGSLLRAVSSQMAPELLAIVLAMGIDRSDESLVRLQTSLATDYPWLAGQIDLVVSPADRSARLNAAVADQLQAIRASRYDVRSSM